MRRGFSLIELLAVLGIVIILIGLLLPSLTQSREQARRIACAAEMQQLAALISLYADDSRGYPPFLYSQRGHDGQWITPNGVAVPEGYLETAGDFWVYPMLDDFGGDYFHDALLCPNDWVSRAESEEIAADRGVPVEQVRLPLNRSVSRSFYRSPMSLSADGIEDTAPMEERRMKLSDVRYPSAKAMMIEDPPFHDAFRVSDIWNVYADFPYRNMVVATDLSVELRSLADALPGVLPTLNVPPNYIGDPKEYLDHQRMTSAYHHTRDGVLGRDWR